MSFFSRFWSSSRFVDWSYSKFSPYEERKPSGNKGNVDFGAVFPEQGFAWIADTVGHNYEAKGQLAQVQQLADIWQGFDHWVFNLDKQDLDQSQYRTMLDLELSAINSQFEALGKSSTLITAFLLNNELQFTSIGDSLLLAVPISRGSALMPKRLAWRTAADKSSELAGNLAARLTDKFSASGDTMFLMMTDGVYEVLHSVSAGAFRRSDEITETKLKVVQDLVQEALSWPNPAQHLVDAIREATYESYFFHSAQGLIKPNELDDCSVIAFRVNSGEPILGHNPRAIGSPVPFPAFQPPGLEPTPALQAQTDVYAATLGMMQQFANTLPDGPYKAEWEYFMGDQDVEKVLGECSAIVAELPTDPRLQHCETIVEIFHLLQQLPPTEENLAYVTLAKQRLRGITRRAQLVTATPEQLAELQANLEDLQTRLTTLIGA